MSSGAIDASSSLRRAAPLALLALVTACAPEPAPPPEGISPELWALCRDDLRLDALDCALIQAWRLPDALPPARGNAYADDPRAAALGRAFFFDEGFSSVPDVSCATCHEPERAFADGMPTSEVIDGMPGGRNSPSLLDVAWNEGFFFWDGRADSLWSQPLFAMENDIEMASSRLAIAHHVADVPPFRSEYEAIFGALPALDDELRFPRSGRPGDPEWESMSDADRDAVNRVAANVGKALEAYMRRIATGPSAVDRYLDGDREALSPEAREGLRRFVLSGCGSCHSGPRLADDRFHSTSRGDPADRGRARGIEILLSSEFNSEGAYFDRDAGEPLSLPLGPSEDDERTFRTPTMRNVTLTAPYQHDGSRSLAEILTTPGVLYEPGDEVVIEAFLRALEGEPPPAEWANP